MDMLYVLEGITLANAWLLAYLWGYIGSAYYSRQHDYHEYLQSHPKPPTVYSSRSSFDNWVTEKSKTNKPSPRFQKYWSFSTRIISIAHASIVSLLSLILIHRVGIWSLLDYDFPTNYPEEMSSVKYINMIMLIYLSVDALVYFIVKASKKDNLMIGHHIVGASSMALFIHQGILPFNSIYYALTEISTIPLHLSWMTIFFTDHNKGIGSIFFRIFGYSTLLTYFIVRIIGGLLQLYLIISYQDRIWDLHWLPIIFIIGGNFIITTMNIIWFKKLIVMAIGASSPRETTTR